MGFSKQEYGNGGFLGAWMVKNTGVGCCALFQGNLANPGMEPRSLTSELAGGSFITSATWLTMKL